MPPHKLPIKKKKQPAEAGEEPAVSASAPSPPPKATGARAAKEPTDNISCKQIILRLPIMYD
jgi:hypothetical protein